MSIPGDIQGDWRVSRSRTCFNDRMNFLCAALRTASFLIKYVIVLCLVAFVCDREDLICIFGHVDLLTPCKIAQYNRRLQHFLKQMLNVKCFFLKWGNRYECLLDIIIGLKRGTRGKRKLCTELERGNTENKTFWQCILYHHLLWLSHRNYDIL